MQQLMIEYCIRIIQSVYATSKNFLIFVLPTLLFEWWNWNCKIVPINAFINLSVSYWIDYTDIGKEGQWVALSTGRNDYSNWHKVNPDNYRNQDCATNNYLIQGQWDDDNCYAIHPPLCETSGK